MSCANNVLPVYMWPSPEKIPEGLCLRPVQVDTVHFSPEATETNGFSCVSSSLNRTAVTQDNGASCRNAEMAWFLHAGASSSGEREGLTVEEADESVSGQGGDAEHQMT